MVHVYRRSFGCCPDCASGISAEGHPRVYEKSGKDGYLVIGDAGGRRGRQCVEIVGHDVGGGRCGRHRGRRGRGLEIGLRG